MAGHSKWANIRFRKGAQDAKRGKLFTKLIRDITMAAKSGDNDPKNNSSLRNAIDKALTNNMPRDKINKAISTDQNSNVEEVRYEGHGLAGVAIIVDCLTDNRNRTVAEVRHAFSKYGGSLGTDGSVAYLFSKIGQIIIEPGASEDVVMELALDSGADDVELQDDKSIEVTTDTQHFHAVKDALATNDTIKIAMADLIMLPSNYVNLDDSKQETCMKLIEKLESLDDVQEVYSNVALT